MIRDQNEEYDFTLVYLCAVLAVSRNLMKLRGYL